MSNPWAKSFEELRSPYLLEKKAKKDYDGDGKVETGSKEHAGVVHNAIQRAKGGKPDGKDTRKEETVIEGKKRGLWDNIHAKRKRGEKPAKKGDKDYPKTLNVEKYDNTKSPDYDKKKKALAKKHGGAKNIKGHPQYEQIDIEHIDGSVTEITDVIKAPKMVAAPKFSDWREGFIWDEPVDEALKKPKLDIQEKGVKNKVEINPTVATEGLKQARKNVGASTCWDGYKAKGTKKKGGKEVPNCVKEGDMSKDKEGHTTGGFRISDKEAKKAKERLKKKYNKEEVEQIDEMDNVGGKAAAALATGGLAAGGFLFNAAKNAAERLKKKREDSMQKLNMGEEVEKKKLNERERYKFLKGGNPKNLAAPKGQNIKHGVTGVDYTLVQGGSSKKNISASHEAEGEVVTELNRYEKETGKSSGSMNMPKGKPTSKGGTSSPVMRAVRTKIRKETGKPLGQQKKTKGVKGNPQPGDRKESPASTVAKQRQMKKDSDAAMRDTRGT